MKKYKQKLLIALLALGISSVSSAADTPKKDLPVEYITVHGKSLEGNLEGNDPNRNVTVLLPSSYAKNSTKRYPVIYGLHGYTINDRVWADELQVLRSVYKEGAPEFIIVLPSSQTKHNGSMYTSSITTGDWETFIAEELVAYIDKNYRTLADRDSRGLMGHSMGGYGTARIGMKRADVFSALYLMSPCCMSAREVPPTDLLQRLANIKTFEEAEKLGFFERATFAVASAWSPNPHNPPFYVDLPMGEPQKVNAVMANWAANAPIAMASQYISQLKKYKAIAVDVGDADGLKTDAEIFSKQLNDSGVKTSLVIYPGDHVSGVPDRFENHVLPFFNQHLKK
jgi:S-formylglutathione hydrolase FrmB